MQFLLQNILVSLLLLKWYYNVLLKLKNIEIELNTLIKWVQKNLERNKKNLIFSNLIFFYREKEMNEKYLRRIEEDQEREMRQLENKIRKEVCSIFI